jgi:hypothetical protein
MLVHSIRHLSIGRAIRCPVLATGVWTLLGAGTLSVGRGGDSGFAGSSSGAMPMALTRSPKAPGS